MQVLSRREILGGRLEHPRPVSLLRQHPRCTNDRSVFRGELGGLAVEVRLPDALHGEVRQIVYALIEHEPPSSPGRPTPPRPPYALLTLSRSIGATNPYRSPL